MQLRAVRSQAAQAESQSLHSFVSAYVPLAQVSTHALSARFKVPEHVVQLFEEPRHVSQVVAQSSD